MTTTLHVRYDDRDLKTLQELLTRLGNHQKNLRGAVADMGEYLLGSTHDRFEAEEDPDGLPWEPVAAATMRRKRIKKVLTESSNLRRRIVYQAGETELQIGTNVVYAGIHQFGGRITMPARSTLTHFRITPNGWRFSRRRYAKLALWTSRNEHEIAMPARPFLGLSTADGQELVEILHDHIKRALET